MERSSKGGRFFHPCLPSRSRRKDEIEHTRNTQSLPATTCKPTLVSRAEFFHRHVQNSLLDLPPSRNLSFRYPLPNFTIHSWNLETLLGLSKYEMLSDTLQNFSVKLLCMQETKSAISNELPKLSPMNYRRCISILSFRHAWRTICWSRSWICGSLFLTLVRSWFSSLFGPHCNIDSEYPRPVKSLFFPSMLLPSWRIPTLTSQISFRNIRAVTKFSFWAIGTQDCIPTVCQACLTL